MSRLTDVQRLYVLLAQQTEKIGGAVPLANLDMRMLPQRGVYFFFELSEHGQESGTGLRVVRVGTHALGHGTNSTLKQRLKQHRGSRSGNGNHRGSIFRLLVGEALMNTGRCDQCQSWGVRGHANAAAMLLGQPLDALQAVETPIEHAVSLHLGAMKVIWIEIGDEPAPTSMRGRIERNTIALLSNMNASLDASSLSWLGLHSHRHLVRNSGLWNQNHVEDEYDPKFLNDLEHLIEGSNAKLY